MPKALIVLQKVVVNYFYRVNAGLFVFGFFVLFGLPYSVTAFHYSMITGIVQSQTFLGLVMVSWLLYNAKCIDYVVKQLQHQQLAFLFSLNGLSVKRVYWYNLYVQVMVYLPVLLYSVAIVVIALKKHEYVCASEVIIFDSIILFATPFVYLFALQRRSFAWSRFTIPSFNVGLRKPFFLYPLFFLFAQRKQMVLVTKIFSLLLLYGFIRLYEPERYDVRPILLCLLIVAAANSAIVFEIRMFEEEYLAFSKNFPLIITGRFVRMTALYVCLLLPESVFLLKGLNLHFAVTDYPQLWLLLIALVSLFHVVLLLANTSMEQFIRIIFGIVAGCFFIILYNPGFLLPVAILSLSFVLFNSYYYEYEKQ